MRTFHVSNEFMLDGNPLKIISGAIHYFRIVPEYWQHSLDNLKALGANCVETYVPWNLHQPKHNCFNFSGIANIELFIELAQRNGLLVILRPSPYICAEWEFGGLPAWLLKNKNIRVRSSQPEFLQAVHAYYSELLPRLTRYQYSQGGPIIMLQLENEYGSFGNDKYYLRSLATMIRQYGINIPLFTSDGAWQEALEAGSLPDENILATGNFGSLSWQNLDNLAAFQPDKPLMCMEFWDGWFNRYAEPIIHRDAADVGNEVDTLLSRASINLYMFHGGTNFGFMNGCSARGEKHLPQITSYDYDALLTEWGEACEKYFAVQQVIKKHVPDCWQATPYRLPRSNFGPICLSRKVSLFNTLTNLSQPISSQWPLTMEDIDQNYGYILYRTQMIGLKQVEKCRIIDAGDRVQLFKNGQHLSTQYQQQIGENISFILDEQNNTLDLLIENMGRVNYGTELLSARQRKGLRGGLLIDLHLQAQWQIYPLPLDNPQNIDFDAGATEAILPAQPAFYEYCFFIEKPADTFLDIRSLGKGVALINDFNIGRYWNKGPQGYLYIPAPLLLQGENKIIIFDTEGICQHELQLLDHPVYIDVKGEG